ncbi:hypothetical protein B7P43_G05279 [Cryptotermes secundus]|uniref:DDE-1 domain-containing protein n=1 Tax=Cryptotermes secundus TaxID=105785 RepID=A0A2J7PZW0_9NEOP|nr:hypothetical protein B7P43_G05279 [Cryptotermes secundus]
MRINNYVHKRTVSAVKRAEFVSCRMSYIILRVRRCCDIILLNVQAPTEDKIYYMKDSFYEELKRVFNKFFKPKIWNKNLKKIITDPDGRTHSQIGHILIAKRHPDGRTHSQIGHILIAKRHSLFERCFEVTEGTNLTLREFWKYHFHIVACLKMIEKTWEGVTKRTLTSAWKKLWPDSVVECDFEGFEIVPVEPVVNEIVSLAKIMGLEVNNNDIDELVEEHSQELSTEELMELHCVSQKEVVEESLSEEEVTAKQQSSGAIREMLKAWETVASYIEKHRPNRAVAMRATNLFNDNAVSHFYQTLKRRQKNRCL